MYKLLVQLDDWLYQAGILSSGLHKPASEY